VGARLVVRRFASVAINDQYESELMASPFLREPSARYTPTFPPAGAGGPVLALMD
jgi:hypothetical protein